MGFVAQAMNLLVAWFTPYFWSKFMENKALDQWNIAGEATKYIVTSTKLAAIECRLKAANSRAPALALGAAAIAGCTGGPATMNPLPFYRCEYGIEFTAKFSGDSVVLDSTRGYDVLYRTGKNANPEVAANAKIKPHEYSNTRMSAEFNLGVLERDAIVRYPLLPLVSRCVRDN
jgi:hypothetical protein